MKIIKEPTVNAIDRRLKELEKTKAVREYIDLMQSRGEIMIDRDESINPDKVSKAVEIYLNALEGKGWVRTKEIWNVLDANLIDRDAAEAARKFLKVRFRGGVEKFWSLDESGD